MTNDEINKYIHEQIMGKCWHEQGVGSPCSKCSEPLYIASRSPSRFDSGSWVQNPNYCSDASPRRLLNEVVANMVADSPYGKYDERSVPNRFTTSLEKLCGDGTFELTTATAEQIARAAVAAHQEAK